jgi:protein-disulfide isomerase
VTVVEFSDFQCPFCKRAADALAEIPEDLRDSVRVVFKQRPLPMHAWARPAALASICAGLQNEEAFWVVERYLFAHQEAITPEAASAMIREFVSKDARLNVERFDACLAGKEAEALLLRDEKLAQAYHVDSTPTVFVNGVRKPGFSGPAAFWSLVRAAVVESHESRLEEPRASDRPPQ